MYNTTVTLKKGEGRTLKAGGMWVFDNEIASILGTFENGDIVNIHDFDGYFMGYGYINTNSKITLRLLARRKDTVIDEAFFEQRVRDAWNYRKETIDTSSCRLIFGEADFLPGIVIDKFSDVLVVESLALGIDKWKLVIIDALKKVLAEDGITIRGVYGTLFFGGSVQKVPVFFESFSGIRFSLFFVLWQMERCPASLPGSASFSLSGYKCCYKKDYKSPPGRKNGSPF